ELHGGSFGVRGTDRRADRADLRASWVWARAWAGPGGAGTIERLRTQLQGAIGVAMSRSARPGRGGHMHVGASIGPAGGPPAAEVVDGHAVVVVTRARADSAITAAPATSAAAA